MQRPVMNPTFFEQMQPRRRFARLAMVGRIFRLLLRILLMDPLTLRLTPPVRMEDGSRLSRFIRGAAYRIAFLPFVIVLIVIALVFAGTHPPQSPEPDPALADIYYEGVSFPSSDGTPLTGWLVPVVDAKRVLEQKDAVLRHRYASVVLVHDYGASRQTLLPLIRPLHESGLVVLCLGLRGSGASGAVGHTFGLREADDVLAAVQILRTRPYTDAKRVAVLGVGTGASACLLAAKADPSIAALILENPVGSSADVIAARMAPGQSYFEWMQPLCKWTFEIAYHVDADDLDFSQFKKVIASHPTLLFDGAPGTLSVLNHQRISQIRTFLHHHLLSAQEQEMAAGT